jgi:hypothetical protein
MDKIWKLEKLGKICTECKKNFNRGDKIASSIFEKDGKFLRQDYCLDCWKTLKPASFSYWLSTYPEPKESKLKDPGLLIEFFKRLLQEDAPVYEKVKFFTALMLLRKRKLKLLQTLTKDNKMFMQFEKIWDAETVEIAIPCIKDDEIIQIKDQLQHLFDEKLTYLLDKYK